MTPSATGSEPQNGMSRANRSTRPRIPASPYAVYAISYSPADGAIWGSSLAHPGYIMRVAPGRNPPETALTELYKIPLPGFGIRGMDVDREGGRLAAVVIASFDRRKCKGPLNGPGAETGEKCPRVFCSMPFPVLVSKATPGPKRIRISCGWTSTTFWGLAPMCRSRPATNRMSTARAVGGQIIELRVPYPMGFFAKGLEGRIDYPNAGWKGRELWATSGNRTPFHIEGIDHRRQVLQARRPSTHRARWLSSFSCAPIRLRIESGREMQAPAEVKVRPGLAG